MSIRKALAWQIAVMLALIASVVMARAFAETPWLMLPFVFAWISFSTYVGATRKLGAGLVVIQIVCLITFYDVIFLPEEIGWNAAASFDGSAIAFGVIVLFDNWLWPDPGEPILMESLGASVARARSQLLEASNFFLAGESVPRPPLPAPTSDLPAHMALLDQARGRGRVRASPGDPACCDHARGSHQSRSGSPHHYGAREPTSRNSHDGPGRNSRGGRCDRRCARRDLPQPSNAHCYRRGRASSRHADACALGDGQSGRARR